MQIVDSGREIIYISHFVVTTYVDTQNQRRANNSKARKNPWKTSLFQNRANNKRETNKHVHASVEHGTRMNNHCWTSQQCHTA